MNGTGFVVMYAFHFVHFAISACSTFCSMTLVWNVQISV